MVPEQPDLDTGRGVRPGDTPSGARWPKSLWVITPSRPTLSQIQSLKALRKTTRCHADISVTEAKIEDVHGYDGLTYPLVRATDIAGLYRQAHRSRLAVIALCAAKVLLDISERPSNGGCMSLERFVRYKCTYFLVTRSEEVERTLGAALDWMASIHCEGPGDPRCYPAAIFETQREYMLGTEEQRRSFLNAHRHSKRSNSLADSRGRIWEVGAAHTRDLLQVAGKTLPIGFHWDVQAQRDSVIATGWERWELPGRGYTNVHPDGFVRAGSATRTHRAAGLGGEAKPLRTPRDARQRRRRS
jgi:hypothetical protein